MPFFNRKWVLVVLVIVSLAVGNYFLLPTLYGSTVLEWVYQEDRSVIGDVSIGFQDALDIKQPRSLDALDIKQPQILDAPPKKNSVKTSVRTLNTPKMGIVKTKAFSVVVPPKVKKPHLEGRPWESAFKRKSEVVDAGTTSVHMATQGISHEKLEGTNVLDLDIWEPEVIEGASVGTFQGRIPKGEKRFGRYDWGHAYTPVRVACFIPTLWSDKQEIFDILIEAYGRYCDLFKLVLCENENPPKNDSRVLVISCDYRQGRGIRNIWNKVMYMWLHAGTSYLEKYDWFLKIDDDTYFSPPNFRNFVQYYDPLRPWYLGHTLLHRWNGDNIIFNSGTCYAMSQGTLRLVTPVLSFIASRPPARGRSRSECISRSGDEEDPAMSICMRSVGILPANSLSREHKQRWLPFRDTDHIIIHHEPTWYWRFKPRDAPDLENCCVRDLVAMHNYKRPGDVKKMIALSAKYNGTGETKIPQEPSLFEYEKASSLKLDSYLNTRPASRSQCLWQGVGFNFTCRNRAEYAELYEQIEKSVNKYFLSRS